MPNDTDDVLDANAGGPEADIPDLKKRQEKERKRGGAAWGLRGGSKSPFSGAAGGARSAASAASAAQSAALAPAGGGLLASLTATAMGKAALGLGAVLVLGGAGLYAFGMLKGGDAAMGGPALGGIASSMRVRAGGGDRIGVASKGEIRFDPVAKPAPAPVKEEAPKDETAAAEALPGAGDEAAAARDQLAHNLSGAKLSSSLGGAFGGKNIFGGSGSAAPKFNEALSKVSIKGAKPGKSTAMKRAPRATGSQRRVARIRSNSAMRQLGLTRQMSLNAARAGSIEGAAATASDAFNQQSSQGGGINAEGDGDTVVPPGGDPDTPTVPNVDDPTGTGVDEHLQNMMNQIGQLADSARQMQQMGTMMMVLGVALIAIGSRFLPWGAVLMAIGAMIVAFGMSMKNQAKQMADMAKQMGQVVATQVGDYQGDVVNYCTDQALAGTPTDQCNPGDDLTHETTFDETQQEGVEEVGEQRDELGTGGNGGGGGG